jgi:hypothetical protein
MGSYPSCDTFYNVAKFVEEVPLKLIHFSLIHWCADNEAIVFRIIELKQWKRVYPNITMESEWDVLAEIKATLDARAPASQPTFAHIKGHQDRTRP